MKNILFFIIAVPLIFGASCLPPKYSPAPAGKITALIDGHTWGASGFNAEDFANNFGRCVRISTWNSSDKQIGIEFYGLTIAGVYPVTNINGGPTGAGFAMAAYNIAGAADHADTGQVIVTNVTGNSIEGTFTFVTAGGVNITDGSFNISLLR